MNQLGPDTTNAGTPARRIGMPTRREGEDHTNLSMEQEQQLSPSQPSGLGEGSALPTVIGEGGAEYPSLERRSL